MIKIKTARRKLTFIWDDKYFDQPLPQLAIDWEDSSADAHFFLERTPARRRNTIKHRDLAVMRRRIWFLSIQHRRKVTTSSLFVPHP